MTRKVKAAVALAVIALLALFAWYGWRSSRKKAEASDIETAVVEQGPLVVTVSATGVLEPLTTVEVKSRSGGEIIRLPVKPGDMVRTGQVIAQLDPTQLSNQVIQREAQVRAAEAELRRAKLAAEKQAADAAAALADAAANVETQKSALRQAELNLALTRQKWETDVKQAEADLAAAKANLREAEARAAAAPELTKTSIVQRQADVAAAEEQLSQLKEGARPEEIIRQEAAVREAQASADIAAKDLKRQEALFAKGFVSQQSVDQARQAYETATARLQSAKAALDELRAGPREQEIRSAEAQLERAKAALRQAQAQVDVEASQQQLEAARARVKQAEVALEATRARRGDVDVREKEVEAAKARLKQAEAQLKRARSGFLDVQSSQEQVKRAAAAMAEARASLEDVRYSFENSTVVAPRSGIILTRPVEEGTVIPPGTSLYSQGTTIATIADISEMYVMAKVEESDIGRVKVGQKAQVEVEVLPDKKLKGEVVKVYPQGEPEQDVVYYRVRVKLLDVPKALRPGMTADVAITVARLESVLKIPDIAIDRSGGKTRVSVLENGQPVEREIKAGITNWQETQVISGLTKGEQVILPSASGERSSASAGRGRRRMFMFPPRRR